LGLLLFENGWDVVNPITRPFGDGLYNPVISISGDFGAGCPNE